jgi:hypothetical protein
MDIATARKLKDAFDTIMLHLNQNEVNAIAAVIGKACDRLLQTEGDKENHATVYTGGSVRPITRTDRTGNRFGSNKGYSGGT